MKMWGILLIVVGLLCIAAPFVAGTFASMFIGASILVAGVAMTLGAMQAGSWGTGIFGTLIGLLTALAGLYMLTHPVIGLLSITLALAIYFMVDGVFQIVGALQARPANGWALFLFGGLLSLVLGYIIYSGWPISGAWVVGTLAGIRFIFGGMTILMIGDAVESALDGAAR